MPNTSEKSSGYIKSELRAPVPTSVPIPAPGIGSRISELATSIGTRDLASEVIGTSPAQLQRYIKGTNMPPFDIAARLCLATGRSMEWLATGIGPQPPAQAQRSPAETREMPASESSARINQATLGVAIGMALAHEQDTGRTFALDELAAEVAGNYRQLMSTVRGVSVGSVRHKAIRDGTAD